MLYFDHNATHPISPAARTAWLETTERFIGNPSSPHRLGTRARVALRDAREKLAGWLGCETESIFWTSGATEANNAALHYIARTSRGEAWISAIEHPSVIEATRRHFQDGLQMIPATREGLLDLDWLRDALTKSHPALVVSMAANNETGVLQPWQEVRTLCRHHGVPLVCDAAQWIGRKPASGLGACEYVSGCAHKFGGPQGVGFLKVPEKFYGQIVGGVQEEGRRAGTENVPGVLAMIAALEEREGAGERDASLREHFEAELMRALPGTIIVGAAAPRLWNTVSALMPEPADDRQRMVVRLDRLGFAVSTGSACASGRAEPSHVLAALGYTIFEAARVLRFSSGWETTAQDWEALLGGVVKAFTEPSGLP